MLKQIAVLFDGESIVSGEKVEIYSLQLLTTIIKHPILLSTFTQQISCIFERWSRKGVPLHNNITG